MRPGRLQTNLTNWNFLNSKQSACKEMWDEDMTCEEELLQFLISSATNAILHL